MSQNRKTVKIMDMDKGKHHQSNMSLNSNSNPAEIKLGINKFNGADIDNIDNEFKNMCKKLEISNIFYKIDENNQL